MADLPDNQRDNESYQEWLERMAQKYNGLGNDGFGDPVKDWP